MNCNTVLQIASKWIDIVIDQKNIVESKCSASCKDVKVLDVEEAAIGVVKLACMLPEVSVLNQFAIWIKVVEDWVCKPLITCGKDSNFEVLIGEC